MSLLSKDSRAASDRARAEQAAEQVVVLAAQVEQDAQTAIRGIKVKGRLFNVEALPIDPEIGDAYVIAIEGIDRMYLYDGTSWSIFFDFKWGDLSGTVSDQADLQALLNGKEPAFAKNSGFNRAFGTALETIAQGNDSRFTDPREWTAETVSQVEAEGGVVETRRAWSSLRVRQATTAWWATIVKNTAFNKNFGTVADTVTQGDDERLSNAREWTGETVGEVEAQAGTATTRRVWTALRVRQAIVAWWATITLTKSDVGLANVDNTSDANKPVSTAQQTALDLKANDAAISVVGKTGDYNDILNKPDLSAFDSIETYANLAAFPGTGTTGTVYIANDTGTSYRWIDGAYVPITDKSANWGLIEGSLAAQTDLQTALDSKENVDATIIKQANVVNNLTSTSTLNPLSANQGKQLQDTKAAIADIVDSLGSTDPAKPLSANQGRILNEGKEPADATILKQGGLINNLTSNSVINPLTANQGKVLNGKFPVSVQFLVVGGGGGGGNGYNNGAGGGGAGGFLEGFDLFPLTPVLVTVGAGGAVGSNGSNSLISRIARAIGGGKGGHPSSTSGSPGADGASGGGGSAGNGAEGAGAFGYHIRNLLGQGKDSGGSYNNASSHWAGGGGGGASQNGAVAILGQAGKGGNGLDSSITGASVIYAGGGGGKYAGAGSNGAGGTGGGGTANVAGTANTGGGGGGEAAGGSGVVILRYPAAYNITIEIGLTGSTDTDGDFKITTLTAGSDTIQFNLA